MMNRLPSVFLIRATSIHPSRNHFRLPSYSSASGKTPTISLTATAPNYAHHLILHSANLAQPDWPPKIEARLPLYSALSSLIANDPSLSRLGLSLSHSTAFASAKPTPNLVDGAYLYSAARTISLPEPLSTETLGKFVDFYRTLASEPDTPAPVGPPALATYDVYVCTHASRDCRCGDRGIPLLAQLEQAYGSLPVRVRADAPRLRFFPVSHVGGHKFAANVLVYPSGDWYGLLDPAQGDGERLLKYLLRLGQVSNQKESPVWWEKWRGRIGIDKEAQQVLHDQETSNLAVTGERDAARKTGSVRPMDTQVSFQRPDGVVVSVDARIGEDLRTIAKRNNLPGMEASCGGKCECATCTVYLYPKEEWIDAPLKPISEEEEDILCMEIDRPLNTYQQYQDTEPLTRTNMNNHNNSDNEKVIRRLACQIYLDEELDRWFKQGSGRNHNRCIRLGQY